jgi:hypothetical protein
MNAHNLDAMVVCFADDYVNEWPIHPPRGFRGSEEVRRNWTQIFAGLPNLRARLPRMTVGLRPSLPAAASAYGQFLLRLGAAPVRPVPGTLIQRRDITGR